MDKELAPVQIGQPDYETLEIVDLIHSFAKSADFAQWITDKKFTHTILSEKMKNEIYSRSYTYSMGEEIFFHGKFEVETSKLDNATFQVVTKKRDLISSESPNFDNVKKINISRILAPPYYTVVSKLNINQKNGGMIWEIYFLESLMKIYNKKRDPWRFWRSSRRS